MKLNLIRRNDTGLGVGIGSEAHVVGNVIADNLLRGASLTQTTAVFTWNLIARNGGAGVGAEDANVTLDHNRLVRNGGAGVQFAGAGPFNVLWNVADRNGGDGIDLSAAAPGAQVTGNHTWFNGGLGIDAAPGTTGSRNWAKHNGDARQCVNVSCSTKGKPKK